MASTTEQNNGAQVGPDAGKRLPVFDLKTVIETVTEIQKKAVETASMEEVAKALGYAGQSSTPFYRKIASARAFGLLSQKAVLTQMAIDYIRPDDEETKSLVLKKAILGIPYYKSLVERYANKKLNVDLVANAIVKDCKTEDWWAKACAAAFELSLKFAGMLTDEGFVLPQASGQQRERLEDTKPPKEKDDFNPPPPPPKKDNSDTQEHVLYLDKNKDRQFSFTGPLEITQAEFGRICKWLEFTMIISDTEAQA